MNRGQLIAVLVGVVAAAGLLATALSGRAGEPTAVTAGADTAEESGNTSSEPVETDSVASPEPADDQIEESAAIDVPPNLGPAGTLTDLDGWLQTDAATFEDFAGQVKIVQFWTFGCFNCKNTLDNLADIYATYGDQNFEIIGVHAPEFDFEKDPNSIANAAVDLNVTWPIALDTRKTNFRSWQEGRRFWPRTFVVDANGDIRFDHIGEGAYDELESTVAYLLSNGGA